MKIKELKFKNKTYHDWTSIQEILAREGFKWILEAETEYAVLEINKYHKIIWHMGTWYFGDWHYGIWIDGQFNYGNWHDGVWYNGLFKNGFWHGGKWYKGIFQGEVKNQANKK